MLSLFAWCLSFSVYSNPILTTNPFSSYDSNGVSPHWKWEHASSSHFDIHFPNSLKPLAPRISAILEQAHARLSEVFHWIPKKPAYVVLLDNSDFANGATQAVARYGMVLWITPPESWGSIAFYKDWLELLVIHEYTHYLNLDTTLGLYETLRLVLGDSFLPNSLWPPWMLEGLAVFMETRFTSGGRGRSSDWEGILRSAVQDRVLGKSDFITLDKVNGSNPYFPGGDTRYQFGYHLMNQVATPSSSKIDQGEKLLGNLSYQSGGRVPYFINGNVENLTRKDWQHHWSDFVLSSEKRLKAQIQKIESSPITKTSPLVTDCVSCEVLGSAFSADGQFLAYTLVSSDRRQGLYLRNLRTGQEDRLDDKLAGAHLSFTSDSNFLIYSQFDRKNNYETFSDLWIYSLQSKAIHPLTHRLRARDPQVSSDGRWITFTLTENQRTTLAFAPLVKKASTYELGKISKPLLIDPMDHVGSPHFSKSGDFIYYSFHKNGVFQEDLWEYRRTENKASPIVQDGSFNRYPSSAPDGSLYYVSNRTGVDNLYALDPRTKNSELRTNFITPLSFPSFDSQGKAHGCLLTHRGRTLHTFQLASSLNSKTVAITTEDAAKPSSTFLENRESPYPSTFPFRSESYSSLPSLSPRLWTPLFEFSPGSTTLGGQVVGFDVLNFHRYSAAGAYSTLSQTFDGFLLYSNRSFGSDIRISIDSLTTNVSLGPSDFTFSKQTDLSASFSYPWLSTYSITNLSLNYTLQKSRRIRRALDTSQSQLTSMDYPTVSTLDALLSYSNQEFSNLALAPEGGRSFFIGTRAYFDPSGKSLKWIAKDQEFFRLSPHLIVSPSLKGSWSPKASSYPNANAITQGRTGSLNSLFTSDTFDQMTLRGYPFLAFVSKASVTGAVDLIFPLGRIFRGWGVSPVFFQNLYGNVFAERTQFPYSSKELSSLGGGLRLSSELFFVPVTFGLDFQKGLDPRYGSTDVYFSLNTQLGAL